MAGSSPAMTMWWEASGKHGSQGEDEFQDVKDDRGKEGMCSNQTS